MASRSWLLQELDTILRDVTGRSAEESKAEAQVDYPFQFLVIGNDPTNVNSLLGSAILDMDINQPSPGFNPHGRLPKDKEQFLCLFLDQSNQIAGLVETTQNHLTHVASLDVVMIKPSFQGQRLCKPFVKTTLAHLLSLGFLEISVEVFSQTMGGIPACLCYYRAANELHLKIRYAEKGKLVPLTSESGNGHNKSAACVANAFPNFFAMGVGPSLPTQVPGLTATSSRAVKEDMAQTEDMFHKADGTGKVTPVFEAAEVKHEKKWVVFEEFYDPCTWSEPVCFFESRVEADTLCLQLNLLSSKLIDGTATHFFVDGISSGLDASAKVLKDLQERVADQVAPKPKTSSLVA